MIEEHVTQRNDMPHEQLLENRSESMPSVNHSYLCLRLLKQLLPNNKVEPFPELTLDIANGITPDICVFPKNVIQPNLLHDVLKCQEKPILAIEVVSASQTISEMLQKATQMVQSGVPMVWTVEPYSRSVFVTTPEEETVIHEDVLERAGIHVDFSQIFRKSS